MECSTCRGAPVPFGANIQKANLKKNAFQGDIPGSPPFIICCDFVLLMVLFCGLRFVCCHYLGFLRVLCSFYIFVGWVRDGCLFMFIFSVEDHPELPPCHSIEI